MSTMAHIFLSYAKADLDAARRLYAELVRRGITVWFDEVSLVPGLQWRIQIENAIEASSHFLALLSSRSLNHVGYVQKEMKVALEVLDLFPETQIFILPIRLEECVLSNARLKNLQWLDLFPESSYAEGLQKILGVLRPGTLSLRSVPAELAFPDVVAMIRARNYFESVINPEGGGIRHAYEPFMVDRAEVVLDRTSGLLWTRTGSPYEWLRVYLSDKDGESWLVELNRHGYAGRHDWRLPTLEEAMTLMEPLASERPGSQGIVLKDQVEDTKYYVVKQYGVSKQSARLHIDSIFGAESNLLTSDKIPGFPIHWRVYLALGRCGYGSIHSQLGQEGNLGGGCAVRPVCIPEPGYLQWIISDSGLLDRQMPSKALHSIGEKVTELLRDAVHLKEQGIVIESTTFKTPSIVEIKGYVSRNKFTHPLDLTVELYRATIRKDLEFVAKRLTLWISEFVNDRYKYMA